MKFSLVLICFTLVLSVLKTDVDAHFNKDSKDESHDRDKDVWHHDKDGKDRPHHDKDGKDRPHHDKGKDGPHDKDGKDRPHHEKDGKDKPAHDKGGKDRPNHDKGKDGPHHGSSSKKPSSTSKWTTPTSTTQSKTSFSFYSTFGTTDPPLITTILNSQTSIRPTTSPPINGTTKLPPNNMCPVHCKNIYCKKKTSFIYIVISIKIETKLSIIYNIKIITSFKGILPIFKTGTLEVPKNNTKHKIQLNKTFLFMSNLEIGNNNIVLKSGYYNKLYSLLSLAELAFFGNNPNDYCKRQMDKCDCRYKKCVKKCNAYCQNCDDAESCEDDCEVQCKYIAWYHKFKSHANKPRALSSDEL